MKKRKKISKRKSKKLFTKHSHHHPRNGLSSSPTFSMRGGIRA